MKECIMSFFNAPISNQVPSGVTSVKQLHTYILQRVAEKTDAQRTGRFERRETVPQTEAKLTAIRHTGRGLLLSQGRPPVIPLRRVCHRYRPSPFTGGDPPLARHLVRR